MDDPVSWLLRKFTDYIARELDKELSNNNRIPEVYWGSGCFIPIYEKEKAMQINITIPDADLDGVTIKDLIIADIHLGMICERLGAYDYDMRWLQEKKEQVQDELNKKMKAQNRAKLQKLEAQKAALIPDSEKLKNIEEEIAQLKNKIGLGQ